MVGERPERGLRVLWLGPWHSDSALYGRQAVNQAATQWSRGLLRGLSENGCQIRVCSHCREQLWPGGELVPGRASDFDSTYPVRSTRYLNIPLVRDAWLAGAYRKMVAREVENCRPDVVFSYNLASYHCAVSDIFVRRKIKWIPFVLDQNDPEPDGWRTFTNQARGASGIVFLSHWGAQHCPLDLPRFHLDGGADRWRGCEALADSGKRIVYSGKFDDRYGGLDTLFDIFSLIRTSGCRFLLTGKDPKGRLRRYLHREPRAEYCGFLDEPKLHEIHRAASVFINPRPPDVSDNRMTFPSKLVQYLSYGKPVVSTWTDGLAPDYRDLLLIPDEPTAAGYAEQVERALGWGATERCDRARAIQKWIVETHTWRVQATRLNQWVGEVVGA